MHRRPVLERLHRHHANLQLNDGPQQIRLQQRRTRSPIFDESIVIKNLFHVFFLFFE